jgi:ABC-type nitrate/sulfonate/bicarbonate transport system permease component
MARQLARLYPLLLAAGLWELVARLGLVRPLFLPPLSTVLAAIPSLFLDGDLLGPLLISLFRAAAGLLMALVGGLPIGFAIARQAWARALFAPLVAFGAPAPKIAFLPIFILWFGIGHLSKILLVAATAIFPFILAAQAAAETVPTIQIWAARAMGTSGWHLLRRVLLPASLPSLLSGVRVAVPYAIITAFTAEMIAGGGGLGGALVMAQRYFETPTLYADLLVMLAVGYLTDLGLIALQRRCLRWHDDNR